MNHAWKIIAQLQHVPTCIVGDFNEDVSMKSHTHCCTMFRLSGFEQMVNKPTHKSGTIIDHVCMLQTVNTMLTHERDCYYNDHDCILCLITVELTYITFSWNNGIYIYDTYDIVYPNVSKLLSKMQKYSNIIHKMSIWYYFTSWGWCPPNKNVTVTCCEIWGFHLSCNITSPMIYSNHSQTKYVKIWTCR